MGIFSRLFGRKKTAEEKVPEVREIPETEAHPEVHEMPEAEEHPEVREMPEAETQTGTRGVPEAREAEGFEAMDRETVLAQTVQRLKEKTLKPVIHIDLHAEPAGLADSKLGGVPYLPADGEVPTDKKGVSSGFWHSSGWQSCRKIGWDCRRRGFSSFGFWMTIFWDLKRIRTR